MADLTSIPRKDVGIFNAGLWRIGRLMENWNRLCDFPGAPGYKLRLFYNGAHASKLLPFLGPNWNPCLMKRQGLVVFAGGPPGDPGLAFGSDGPLPVGVMFFPSSPFIGVMLFPSSIR